MTAADLVPWYPWIKSLHVIAVIAWMAGMFYLPRLFVYHADSQRGSTQSETFKVMERRLLYGIMTPAMVASWGFGLLLVSTPSPPSEVDWHHVWPWLKAAGVIGLSGLHGVLARYLREFAEDRNTRPVVFYRLINEVPTLLVIVIVVMVVAKPF